MKRAPAPNGRRHGLRARLAFEERTLQTVLVFRSEAQTYRWTTDRARPRPALKP